MKKPVKPAKPIKPSKTANKRGQLFLYAGMKLSDIIRDTSGVDPNTIELDTDNGYYGETDYKLVWDQEVANTDYDNQMKRYDIKMKKYEDKLLEYKKSMDIYREWQKLEGNKIDDEIKELNKKLKELQVRKEK